jgi:ubiquinol-cytochrome c reductase cytochrome b subunit
MRRRDPAGNLLASSAAGLFVLAGVQIVLGYYLSTKVHGGPDEVRRSIEALRSQSSINGLLVSLHYWGSFVLLLHASFHLLAMLWCGWYQKPHQWRWWGTITLFLAALGFQITGNFLPLDQHDVRTVVVEAGITSRMPGLGATLRQAMLGGAEVGPQTLALWTKLHSVGLPILLVVGTLGAFISHFRLKDTKVFVPAAFMSLFVAFALCLLVEPAGGTAATANDWSSFDAHPSWYIAPLHVLLSTFDKLSIGWVGAMVLPGLVVGFLFALPFIGRKFTLQMIRVMTVSALVVLGGLTLWVRPQIAPISGSQDIKAPEPGPTTSPTPFKLDPKLAEEGQRLFNTQPCANCHGTDGTKGEAGPDLTKGDVLLRDPEVLRDYILNPEKVKKGSTMPAFEGKLSTDQINLLVQFILSHRR